MRKRNRVYIAYGSNMNERQMDYRTPDAVKLATGVLKGYELNFCGNKRGNNYASIKKKEGAVTPILLWSTSPSDEHRLDIYEGYPSFYRKEDITSSELEISKWFEAPANFDSAYVYIMNSDKLGIPSREYFLGIFDAYLKFGISPEPLLEAYRQCSGCSFRFWE